MSGGEPSSIKRSTVCAARKPVLSKGLEDRVGVTFDLGVYGLVLQSGAVIQIFALYQRLPSEIVGFFLKRSEGQANAPSILPKMETANVP